MATLYFFNITDAFLSLLNHPDFWHEIKAVFYISHIDFQI